MTDTARLEAAARRALASLSDLIRDCSDPGTEALGARHELEQALVGAAGCVPAADRAAEATPVGASDAAANGTGAAVAASDRAALRDRIAATVDPLTEADRDPEDGARQWADYMRGWNNARADLLAALGSAAVLPAPADRAAVLREAADDLAEFIALHGPTSRTVAGWNGAVGFLRRLAAESAAARRVAADDCDKAGGAYGERGADGAAGAAFALMEAFLRKANEAEYVAAPCSVGGCEPGGEPCSTHERLMAHAEGDHELCGDECVGVRS